MQFGFTTVKRILKDKIDGMNLVKIQLSLLSGFQGRSKASIFCYILASEPVMFVVITPFKKMAQNKGIKIDLSNLHSSYLFEDLITH